MGDGCAVEFESASVRVEVPVFASGAGAGDGGGADAFARDTEALLSSTGGERGATEEELDPFVSAPAEFAGMGATIFSFCIGATGVRGGAEDLLLS